MVHALEKAHSLLKPDGVLIDIHDLPEFPEFEVHTGGQAHYAGKMLDNSRFERLRQTDAALAQAVSQNLFVVAVERVFDYNIHADSLDAFREWLDVQWDTSYLPDETAKLINDLMRQGGATAAIIIDRSARMTRLRAI